VTQSIQAIAGDAEITERGENGISKNKNIKYKNPQATHRISPLK